MISRPRARTRTELDPRDSSRDAALARHLPAVNPLDIGTTPLVRLQVAKPVASGYT
jgi:hypothetical protein